MEKTETSSDTDTMDNYEADNWSFYWINEGTNMSCTSSN